MIPMICTKDLPYAGRRFKPGDPFNARGESDARVLEAIGKAKRAPAPASVSAAPPPVVVSAPDPIPDPAPTVDSPAIDVGADNTETATRNRQKRAYRRRDLIAEE